MAQYQRLIHEYLDGSIEPYMEEMLFSELARDNGLRREFHQQMAIHRSASSDMAAIATPSELSAEVFSKLGIAPMAGTPAPEVIRSPRSFKKFASIFGGMLTVAALYFLTAQTDELLKDPAPQIAKDTPQRMQPENPISTQSGFAASTSVNSIAKSSAANVKETSFKRPVSFKNSTRINNVSANTKNQDKIPFKSEMPAEKFTGIYYVHALPSNFSGGVNPQNSFASGQTVAQFFGDLLKTHPVAIQLNGASDFKSMNSTVSVLFDKSENVKFGLEGGYETFVVNSTKSVNGEILKMQERQQNWTAGLVGRILVPEISPFENFVPFTQLYIGTSGHNFPILTKATAGVVFKANDRFYLLLGGEYAGTLLSKQLNNRYQATLGAGIKF